MRVRQKQPLIVNQIEIARFNQTFRYIIEELPQFKRDHLPRYATLFQKKFLLFLYLMDIEAELHKFSPRDIFDFFRCSRMGYANDYFLKLIAEGWIIQINKQHTKSLYGSLSPMALEAITLLRRRIEAKHAQLLAIGQPKPKEDEFSPVDLIPKQDEVQDTDDFNLLEVKDTRK